MDEKIVKDRQSLVKDLVNDTISRQATIMALVFSEDTGGMTCGQMAKVLDVIKAVPSVQPDRKTGRWKIIMARHKYNGEYREMRQCSECHAAYFHYANQEDIEDEIPNYCPNCGADMREDDHETN